MKTKLSFLAKTRACFASMRRSGRVLCLLLALTAVTAGVYFGLVAPAVRRAGGGETDSPFELHDGEGYYTFGGRVYTAYPVVYPSLSPEQIFRVTVHNAEGGEYLFFHHRDAGGSYFLLGTFEGASYDEGGTPTFFLPAMSRMASSFDYTSLYDARSRVPALLNAVGNILFDSRVWEWSADEDPAEVERKLRTFGLAEEDGAPWFEVTPFLLDRLGQYCYTDGTTDTLYYYDRATDAYYAHTGVTLSPEGGYVYDPAAAFVGDVSALTPAADTDGIRRVYVGRALSDNGGYYLRLRDRRAVYAVRTVSSSLAQIDYSRLVYRDLSYYAAPSLLPTAAGEYDPLFSPDLTLSSGTKKAAGEALAEGDLVTLSYTLAEGGPRRRELLFLSDPTLSAAVTLLGHAVGDEGFSLRDDRDTPDVSDDLVCSDVRVESAVHFDTDISFGYFGFVGNGQKDPYFGESIYTVKAPASLGVYGIDFTASVGALTRISGLCGLTQSRESASDVDWSAAETVAVGPGGYLTPELLVTDEWDLTAHRLSFTLPYGVQTDGNNTGVSYTASVTATLYISDASDGYRYAASDLFGTVVRVDAALFDFLDWDVLGRWSRGNLFLTARSNLRSLVWETSYADRADVSAVWLSEDTVTLPGTAGEVSRTWAAFLREKPHTVTSTDTTMALVTGPGRQVSVEGNVHRVTDLSGAWLDLDAIWTAAGHTESDGIDGAGVSAFGSLYNALVNTYYTAEVSADLDGDEVTALTSDPAAWIARLTVTLTDGRVFVYSFGAYSARRCAVRVQAYVSAAAAERGECLSDTVRFALNRSEVDKFTYLFDCLGQGVSFDIDDFY